MARLRLRVTLGDPRAQNLLGSWYSRGEIVEFDPCEAARLWGLAAAQGDAHAQNNLACMYRKGQGVTRDAHEAARLWLLAADQGINVAMYSLVFYYREVLIDPESAQRWLRTAAQHGHIKAQREWVKQYESDTKAGAVRCHIMTALPQLS